MINSHTCQSRAHVLGTEHLKSGLQRKLEFMLVDPAVTKNVDMTELNGQTGGTA